MSQVVRSAFQSVVSTSFEKNYKTLDDILYENRFTPSVNMKSDVDAFMESLFAKKSGIIDNDLLANTVSQNIVYNPHDAGHMSVLGYIITKYCNVSNECVRKFLRNLAKELDDFEMFRRELMTNFGVIPYIRDGTLYFRKFCGLIF